MNTEQWFWQLQLLVDFFHPYLEVTVFADNKLIKQWNPLSTSQADSNQSQTPELSGATTEVLSNNLFVKQQYAKINEQYILRLRYDCSVFNNLQQQVAKFITPISIADTTPWKQKLDDEVNAFLIEQQLNINSLTKKQKIALTTAIFAKGLLDFKEATSYLATTLEVSRATIYNYLNWHKSVNTIEAHQVNAFTADGKGGNPAGVVLNAGNLDIATMKNIARGLELSETSFVVQKKQQNEQLIIDLLYFTRTGVEVDFCGHSTVGAICMLIQRQEIAPGQNLLLNTKLGTIKAAVHSNKEICYVNPAIKFKSLSFDEAELLKALGLKKSQLDSRFSIKYEARNKDLFVMVNNLNALQHMVPHYKNLAKFCKNHTIVAVCVVSPETIKSNNDYHIRCFCPAVGIDEDPVTGSIANGLVNFLVMHDSLSKSNITIEQGHFINKPGIIKLEVNQVNDVIEVVTKATAKHFSSSEIYLD